MHDAIRACFGAVRGPSSVRRRWPGIARRAILFATNGSAIATVAGRTRIHIANSSSNRDSSRRLYCCMDRDCDIGGSPALPTAAPHQPTAPNAEPGNADKTDADAALNPGGGAASETMDGVFESYRITQLRS